jgi:hypothetical protein
VLEHIRHFPFWNIVLFDSKFNPLSSSPDVFFLISTESNNRSQGFLELALQLVSEQTSSSHRLVRRASLLLFSFHPFRFISFLFFVHFDVLDWFVC